MQKPRFFAMPALLFAAGLGLIFYYGHAWYRLPVYSTAEIEQSVEINLALDQQRRGVAAPTDEAELAKQRQGIADALAAEIHREQREVRGYVGTGVILLLMGLAQMVILRRMAAR